MHARVGIAFVCNYPKGLCPTISVPSPVFDFSNCLTHPTESCHKHLPPFLKKYAQRLGGAGTRRRSTCSAPLRLPASAFLSAAPHPGTKVVSPGGHRDQSQIYLVANAPRTRFESKPSGIWSSAVQVPGDTVPMCTTTARWWRVLLTTSMREGVPCPRTVLLDLVLRVASEGKDAVW